MHRIRVLKDRDYTVVNNTVIKDARLSLKAKGLFVMIMSLPDDWDFSITGTAIMVAESKHNVYAAIKELIAFGYCVRKQLHEKGKIIGWDYTFIEQTSALEQDCILQDVVIQDVVIQDVVIQDVVIQDLVKQDLMKLPQLSKDINQVKKEQLSKNKKRAKTTIPNPFLLTAKMKSWGVENVPNLDLIYETSQFVDHFRNKGDTGADWVAKWRTWMRNAFTGFGKYPNGKNNEVNNGHDKKYHNGHKPTAAEIILNRDYSNIDLDKWQ